MSARLRRPACIGVLCALLAAPTAAFAVQQTKADLEREKLQQEVDKLKNENSAPLREFGGIAALVAVATAMVGVGGLLIAWRTDRNQRKQASDAANKEAQKDREQRSEAARAARDQREKERLQRQEADFADFSTKLASDQPGLRAAGAAGMEAFLLPERAGYRDRLLSLLVALVKLDRREATGLMIARLFARLMEHHSLELRRRAGGGPVKIDLEGSYLCRVDLDRVFLRGSTLAGARLHHATLRSAVLNDCDIAGAELHHTDLTGAFLRQARGLASGDDARPVELLRARVDAARLTSADLRRARCSATSFRDCELQDLDLRNATLEDVSFHGADLRGADFRGATYKGTTLETIVRAANWREATFDPEVVERLDALE